MDVASMTAEEIRAINLEMLKTSRGQCATVGAVWYEINKRELWKEFGYRGFMEFVEQEGPRAYSTITECMRVYEYYVINSCMSFDSFKDLIEEHGIRKASMIRREAQLSLVPNPNEAHKQAVTQEDKIVSIRKATEKIMPLSVRDAQDTIRLTAEEKGIVIEQTIVHRISLTPEQEEIFSLAIELVRNREKGNVPISDSFALILALSEYLGLVIPRTKAA